MNNIKDNILVTEPVGRLLLKMATPAIIGQIVNMLYNIVDRIFIANIKDIGTLALTGVGITFPIILLISAFASLIGMGGAPRVSIKMGEDRYEEAEEILSNCFVSLIIISIILTITFLIFGEKLLLLFGASENTLQYGLEYINIYLIGTIFVQLTLGLNMFISSQGFAKTSMKTILIGACLNIILDFVFIKIFDMGVKGAAYATVISQAVSAIWVIRFLTISKSTKIRIKKKYFKIKRKIILPVLALGISPFIMQSTESLLNIAFNSSLKNYGGDIAVGAMSILSTIMQCIALPATGISQGASPIISFNYGAGNKERVKTTFKLLLISSLTFTTIAWLIIMLKTDALVSIFLNRDSNIFEYTKISVRIYLSGVFILGCQYACQQTFVALGEAKTSLFLALLRKIVLLIPLIYILPNILPIGIQNTMLEDKVFYVLLAEPISDFIATTTTIIMFSIIGKKIINKINKNN